MSTTILSESRLAVVLGSSLRSDTEHVEDRSSGSDSEDYIIPQKIPVSLCADCKRLFERQNWSWERYEPYDGFQEPYHRVLPESLPRPRLRPMYFWFGNPSDYEDECKLCSLVIARFQQDIRRDVPTGPAIWNIREVSDFRWGLRLYDNGFIELWLGYDFYDPLRSWDMSHLVTLVPITEVGLCARSPNPSECGFVSFLSLGQLVTGRR